MNANDPTPPSASAWQAPNVPSPPSPGLRGASDFDIVGVGENSIDYVYLVPEFPNRDRASKVEIAGHVVSPGGQVTTTLCTCAALGLRTSYVGAFGSDDKGLAIREALQVRGVDLQYAPTRQAASRYAVILVEQGSGDRAVLWHRDPALVLRTEELPRDLIQRARLLHVDGVDEDIAIAAATIARDAGIAVTSDVDRMAGRTRELIASVTVPIFAEGIPEALTGEPDLERALRRLRQDHRGWLCTTLGARGAALLAGETLYEVTGHRVTASDTTGAGDVFRGAFIVAMLRGDAPGDVLRFANAAAAVSCTRLGAIAGVPTRAEVDEMLSGSGLRAPGSGPSS